MTRMAIAWSCAKGGNNTIVANMNIIEVFKTNIRKRHQSKILVKKLLAHYPESRVNIDLDDCDNVLRVEGTNICPFKIIELVTADGYQCETLP